MKLGEAIDAIEGCENLTALTQTLQRIAEDYGFASYAFVDLGQPGRQDPLVIATTPKQWDSDYRTNNFLEVDPVLPVARRVNLPFSWGEVRFQRRIGNRKSGALRTMEAARDHGFKDGLVVPFHSVDSVGAPSSASCGFFWRDKREWFLRFDGRRRREMQLILIYWAQSVARLTRRPDIILRDQAVLEERAENLTERERGVLVWAARGKTMDETGAILAISSETVSFHLRNAMKKLDSVNKTQAVVKAIKLGLIDI